MWNFPNCIGSIDGKHVRIKCPAHSGTMFFNYKKFFSVHLQGITDARYKFITIDVGDYGRRRTNEHVPHVFLGDQGYPLKEYLMRPYPTMNNIDQEKENFNYRLSRARRSVECAFGILVSKWRCLKTELQVEPCHVDTIVKTVCLLHNIVID
ncbi:protein ALP1-like, partial [Aphis craccivora]